MEKIEKNFNPKVSIIIPVYNGANYMREAIDSVINQTYKNIEIIVVNDGSTDDTEKIALSYGDKIRYFYKENGGVATALNLAIKKADGEYISWLSHDDKYFPEKIEVQIDLMREIGEFKSVFFSDWISIDENNNIIEEIKITKTHPDRMEYHLILEQAIHGCSLLIPKTIFEDVGLFSVDLLTTQDYTLWLKMAEKYHFFHCPRSLVYGRKHSEQGSNFLNHKEDVDNFFSIQIKRLTGIRMTQLFPKDERLEACINLIQMLNKRNLNNCSLIFYNQIKEIFPKNERQILHVSVSDKSNTLISNTKINIMKNLFMRTLKSVEAVLKPNNYKLNFNEVYENNLFEGDNSISGRGSNLDQTIVLKEELIPLLKKLDVKKLLDVPCGDFNWMRHIDFEDIEYIGGDIVNDLVKKNQDEFGNQDRSFQYIDLISSKLPSADAIFCRDVLVHLNYIQIFKVLKNIKKSNIKYLMTTTFTERQENTDLTDGIWRPLNLQKEPFNFPQPVELLNEKCPEGGNGEWMDKCIGVWKVEDLHDYENNKL